jgi:hypothetical protein
MIVTGSWDRTVKYWDLRQSTAAASLNCQNKVYSMDVKDKVCSLGIKYSLFWSHGLSLLDHEIMKCLRSTRLELFKENADFRFPTGPYDCHSGTVCPCCESHRSN